MPHSTAINSAARALLATVLAAGWCATAAAQDFDYGVANAQQTQQVFLSTVTNANIIRGMYEHDTGPHKAGIDVGRPGSRAARARRTPHVVGGAPSGMFEAPASARGAGILLPFRSTSESRRAAAAGLIGRTGRADPQAAQLLAAALRSHDAGAIFAGIVRPFGYRGDDVADTVAAYTLLGWLIATGAPDPTPRAALAVRAQVAQELAASPRFADPAARVALAEEMKLLFVTMHAGWQAARREGSLAAYAGQVSTAFQRQTGSNLRSLQLTDRGFVQR